MPAPYVEGVAQVVADEVAGDDEQQRERRGQDDQSGCRVEELLARLDHVSPVRLRGLDAEAEVGEAGGETGRDREGHDDLGEHRARDVREEFSGEDARGAGAAQLGGDDVVTRRLARGQGTGQPGQSGREGHPDAEDQTDRARPRGRHQQDHQQDGREREREIHDPHQHLLHDTARVPGDEADPRAHDGRQRRGRERDEQQRAGAVHESGQFVTAQVVRTEEMPRGPHRQQRRRGLTQRIRLHEQRSYDRHQDQHDQDGPGQDGRPGPCQAAATPCREDGPPGEGGRSRPHGRHGWWSRRGVRHWPSPCNTGGWPAPPCSCASRASR